MNTSSVNTKQFFF